jgi:hypothetical protein
MNTEEKMWEYFDGTLAEEEKTRLEQLVASDAEALKMFESVRLVHASLQEMEADEPSLSFTRNVMEAVAKLPLPTPLKTKIDKRIIGGIAGFFILTLLALLIPAMSSLFHSDFTLQIPVSVPSVNWSQYFNSTYIFVFMCLNMLLAFVYLDRFLHKRFLEKH